MMLSTPKYGDWDDENSFIMTWLWHSMPPGEISQLRSKQGSKVIFRGKQQGKIIKVGWIGMKQLFFIKKVLVVDNIKHNLLIISQLCDLGCDAIFKKE